MGFESAKMALNEEALATTNAGLIREDANLSLIFVSDEDDFSPNSAYDYLRFFTEIKGEDAYRDNNRMRVSAVVGKDVPPYEGEASCGELYPGDGAAYGPRYVELAVQTGGALESICEDDFSPIAQTLGLTASGLELEFGLSSLADSNTLAVKIYAAESEDSLIEELIQDEDYSYVIERNSIRFEIDALPPSETYIVAEYRVLPDGAQQLAEDTGEAE
jgi:hypothetical protein